MNERENTIKAITFEGPDWIPVKFHINRACYDAYGESEMLDLMASNSFLFPDFNKDEMKDFLKKGYSDIANSNKSFTDDFGCVWKTSIDGIVGTVIEHPIKNLNDIDSYVFPNPEKCTGIGEIDWEEKRKSILLEKEKGKLTIYGLRHGHTFLQLCDLIGYENLLFAMHDKDSRIEKLILGLEEFNTRIVEKYCSYNIDVMSYPEDLGMQFGPMISPSLFKKYIKPSYERLMKIALDKNILVHMHTDGDIKALYDDLVLSGVCSLNIQDLVNGIDWISERCQDKICVEVDIDRQRITPKGSKTEIEKHIRNIVKKIGTKDGGLMLIYGLYPGVDFDNIVYVMEMLTKYAGYYI